MKRALALLLLLHFLSPSGTLAQSALTANTLRLDDASGRPSATIDDVAWMAGRWRANAFGGEVEEVWSPPFGDSMVGTFKIVRNGASDLYELFTLVEEEGSLVIKLKHFNADLSGWEASDEFVSFPLVKLDRDVAYFDGLTYRYVDDSSLRVHLALEEQGEVTETTFDFKRWGTLSAERTTHPRRPVPRERSR